ncbi:MAG: (E)-4-hydroxy-3-methylbut-2-enyl-diphosphate synthase [Chloroflexota bacterium]
MFQELWSPVLTLQLPYVPDLFRYRRRATRQVMVGGVGVGGDNPIRIQSMTTTITKNLEATVDQAERLVRAGCEIVRITTPTPADARCLGTIKEMLAARGVRVPIVADIHFNPAAALAAADFADKVRVNPGNYTDSRKFAIREYTDAQYQDELARVEERFTPLVLKCRERAIAMRIGANHGSLSDRIMNRFGDTPEGMVESALEFVRICQKHGYQDIILSMKASNPKIMIAAYRLLAARMYELDMDYPFHLGVTEAGNAEDGRIKSAIGIGSLLEDGIGDTIRVSLTEEPEAEIPVAFAIAKPFQGRTPDEGARESQDVPWDPFHYQRRPSEALLLGDLLIGGSSPVAVINTIESAQDGTVLARVLRWASPAGKRQPKPDGVCFRLRDSSDLAVLQRCSARLKKWPQAQLTLIAGSDDPALREGAIPFVDAIIAGNAGPEEARLAGACAAAGKALIMETETRAGHWGDEVDTLLERAREARALGARIVLSVRAPHSERIHAYRLLASQAARRNLDAPILLRVAASPEPLLPESIDVGSLLCDGIGDALMVSGLEDATALSFNILQSAGTRLSRTDYVACPSCGRTLFDLQETTDRIKQKTSHLVGVKLAIMGCIVNGPGEMADADFGYVGGAPGQVNLYVGKECVEKGVPAEIADQRLVELIKAHGKWQDED